MSLAIPRFERARESNFFDILRLGAAALVIVGHAWPLSGMTGVPRFAGISIHHLGVYIFFVISGYLLATSWERRPRAVPFLIRRCMRIFPALIVVVAFTVFAIGPLATVLPIVQYWSSGETWQYLFNVTLFAQYELPGVFETNPTTAVNGSLWSLGVEFSCYLMLVVTALLGVRAKLAVRVLIVMIIAIGVLTGALTGPLCTTAIAIVFFVLGSLVARGGKLAQWPVWPALVGLIVIAPLQGWTGILLAWIVVTYAVVAIGSRRSRTASVVRKAGDPSYGMYLWGFPVQQILVAMAGVQPVLVSVAIVLPIAIMLGYSSWWLIERPAIRLGAQLSDQASYRAKPNSVMR